MKGTTKFGELLACPGWHAASEFHSCYSVYLPSLVFQARLIESPRLALTTAHQCSLHACFLKFRMGCHSLPNVSGRWARVARAQRYCLHCDQHVLGDERHLVFECPAVQSIRDQYLALFATAIQTMQQFMWQLDIVSVAHFVMDCFDHLDAVSTSNQPWAAGVDV